MKVLLISPKDPKKIENPKHLMGGENTYTQALLYARYKNIKLYYYEDEIKKRNINYTWHYYICLLLQKMRLLPLGPRVMALELMRMYDVVYSHVYPVRISKKTSLVISDSSSNIVFLEKYVSWSPIRVKFSMWFKKHIFILLGVVDGEMNTHKASQKFVFSRWAQGIKQCKFQLKDFRVLYPGLASPKKTARRKSKLVRILFVGTWFERKGGRIVLSVFRKLSRKNYHISLTLVTNLPSDIVITSNETISHFNHVSYRKLTQLFRSHDILVHIPPKTEGYGMVVPDAMAHQMAVVVSNVCVLPEFIRHNVSGLVVKPGSPVALERALEKIILDQKLRIKLGKKARSEFNSKFSSKVFNKKFERLLQKALHA